MTHFAPDFEPPSRAEWLLFMGLALGLAALVLRGAAAFCLDFLG